MSIRDILVFFFKWWKTIIGSFALIVSAVTILVYLLPPLYQGEATVLVEWNRSPTMRTSFDYGLEVTQVINTEIEIILSISVMAAVVDRLKLHERATKDSALRRVIRAINGGLIALGLIPEMSRRDKWIRSLIKQVTVKHPSQSNILKIQFSDEDPALAARIVNSITDVYIDQHLKVYSTRGSAEFYLQQVRSVEIEVARLRQELIDYKRRVSVSAIGASKTVLVQELSDQRSRMLVFQTELSELLTRLAPEHTDVQLKKNKIAQTTTSMSRIRGQLLELENQEAIVRNMELSIQARERFYLDYRNKYDEAAANEGTNTTLTNVRVVEYSSVPARSLYSRIFLIIISIFCAFILSMCIGFIREYFDNRVLNPDTAEGILGLPVYGSVARLNARQLRAIEMREEPE